MSKTLTYEIPDELYAACEQIAARTGRTTEAVVLEYLAKHAPKPRPQLSEEELRAARAQLLSHAGAVNSGDPHSADNERIDADLAREYGSSHEEEN
jgi:hypothetical protein